MIKPLSAAISTALFACVISPAMAQSTTPTDLDQVIVTGSRTPISIEKVPGAVTVVNQEQVQRTLNLTEDATAVLARMVPGYSESSQAMSNSGETLRGRVALGLVVPPFRVTDLEGVLAVHREYGAGKRADREPREDP